MEIITLTNEIKLMFGLKSAHATIEGKDYIIMIKQLSDELIVFTIPDIEVNYGQQIQIFFPSVYGKVEITITVDCFYENDLMYVIEGNIISGINCVFFEEFCKFILELINQKKRKEERILCNKKNLEKLKLINLINFDFRYRAMRGVIKDISYSGIKVLTNTVLLQDNGSLFTFKLMFKDPEQNFLFVNSHIVRKNLYTFENQSFAEVVFSLENNIKFCKRLDEYFNLNQKKLTM